MKVNHPRVNHPRKLVDLYRAFYRADTDYEPSARKAVQPLYDACETLVGLDQACRSPQTLIDAISGDLLKLMRQIRAGGGALGRWVIPSQSEERVAILRFSEYLVNEVFYGAFNGDMALFTGTQRGLLEDTCEFLYRLAQDAENAAKNKKESVPLNYT